MQNETQHAFGQSFNVEFNAIVHIQQNVTIQWKKNTTTLNGDVMHFVVSSDTRTANVSVNLPTFSVNYMPYIFNDAVDEDDAKQQSQQQRSASMSAIPGGALPMSDLHVNQFSSLSSTPKTLYPRIQPSASFSSSSSSSSSTPSSPTSCYAIIPSYLFPSSTCHYIIHLLSAVSSPRDIQTQYPSFTMCVQNVPFKSFVLNEETTMMLNDVKYTIYDDAMLKADRKEGEKGDDDDDDDWLDDDDDHKMKNEEGVKSLSYPSLYPSLRRCSISFKGTSNRSLNSLNVSYAFDVTVNNNVDSTTSSPDEITRVELDLYESKDINGSGLRVTLTHANASKQTVKIVVKGAMTRRQKRVEEARLEAKRSAKGELRTIEDVVAYMKRRTRQGLPTH